MLLLPRLGKAGDPMTGDGLARATAAAVLLVAAIAAVVSYLHVATLALRYGQPPLAAYLLPLSIDGISLLCQRYDGDLSEQRAIARLSSAHGGVSGLISRAGQLRQSTGSATAQCVAAAAVEVINRGSGGRKLPGWWRNEGSR